MTSEHPNRSALGGDASDLDAAARALRIQILASEHWSLLATRNLSWNESFSRATMFLTVLTGAVVGNDVLLSVRTQKNCEHAAKLLQTTLEGIGGGGGHSHRAGGKIPNVGSRSKVGDDLENDLRTRWLNACGVDRQRGTRLVAKREIVENL